MRNELRDIVKHTGSLGFIETVKITGTATATEIEATATDNTVIVKANLLDPVADFKGVFGLNNLGLLRNLIEFPTYKTDGATVKVKYRERNGDQVPEEIIFKDENGSSDHYRLMAPEVIPDQPKFLGADWNVEVAPTKSTIKEFAQRASMYGALETHFTVNIVDGDLIFYFGDQEGATHKGSMVFEKGVGGTLKGEMSWPIAQVLQILKLSEGGDCTLSITERGALQISIESALAEYRFILPTKRGR